VIRASMTAAAPASTDSVTATASPQYTARTGNAWDQPRQVTARARRRAFTAAYSAMPAAQVTPPAAASSMAVMPSDCRAQIAVTLTPALRSS
jgi:hypothetical protein